MDDLISRRAAIDAIVNKVSGIGLHDNSEVARYGATFRQHEIIDIIESLPSAHPEIEERTEESAQNVPIEDLISRKAAIDALDCINGTEEVLRSLPSAQPEPQWIPVSERLPDDLGDYLVSIKRIGWNMEEYVENDIAYWDDLEGFHKADEVLAWMPLPEPYRAERRTDEGD